MKWLIKTGLLIVLLTSCSAQYHLSRAIKINPKILEKDTVVVVDTIVTAPVEVHDTITLQKRDTITITKERLRVKIIRSYDTLSIQAECLSDTIINTIEVPVDRVVYVPKKSLKDKILGYILYIGLAFVAYKIFVK